MPDNQKESLREAISTAIRTDCWDEASALLQRMAQNSLSVGEASFVASKIREIQDRSPLKTQRIAILRSFTIEPVVPFLVARCVAAGINANVYVGDFNTYSQDFLDPNSQLYAFKPDIVIVAIRTPDLLPELWQPKLGTNWDALIDQTLRTIQIWLETFRQHSNAHVILHNFEMPVYPAHGIYDGQQAAGQRYTIQQLNHRLAQLMQQYSGFYVLDYDGLVARYGYLNWYDISKWLSIRMPIAANHIGYLADEYLRFIRPMSGKVCKALVLDLDNTLWGGVIGEDGLDGIQIGLEYPGSMYRAVQEVALQLYDRGIILAICSKNDYETAMEALEKHPGMLLRPSHFAAMAINWQDKATNLREIAKELEIGVDALAFLDDNPVEREWVRGELPEVAVIELPDAPVNFAQTLQASPVFEQLTLSGEDRKRSQFYAEQLQRKQHLQSVGTLEDFYESLKQQVYALKPTSGSIARIAQLTQKTNQLNMTTRRYSEQDIEQIAADPAKSVYAFRVADRFGDNGLVGVAIVHYHAENAEIDTFLMSCRVIGRTVETALLAFLAQQASERGTPKLSGWFIPTKKNKPAADIYHAHGFKIAETTDDATYWTLDLANQTLDIPRWIEMIISD